MTGAQEALRDTGPQPSAAPWAGQDADGPAPTGSSAYPAQWYDRPVLPDRARDGGPAADPGPADSRPADPRLEGIRYDELRYEEPAPDGPGYDDSVEDESWYAELRRNGPAFPQNAGDQPRPAGPASGPARRAEPQLPAYGQLPGYPQAPAPERFPGYGPSRGDRGTSGPQLSAWPHHQPGPASQRAVRAGQRSVAGWPWTCSPAGSGLPAGASWPGHGLPQRPGRTGWRADPARGQPDRLPAGKHPPLALPFEAPPDVARPGSATVRPGHGLDGPEITSSWPAQPPAEDLDVVCRVLAGRRPRGDYAGLFGDRVSDPDAAGRPPSAGSAAAVVAVMITGSGWPWAG